MGTSFRLAAALMILGWHIQKKHTVCRTRHSVAGFMDRRFFLYAKDTLLKMCAKEFGCTPGVILTLHTWGLASGPSFPQLPKLGRNGLDGR